MGCSSAPPKLRLDGSGVIWTPRNYGNSPAFRAVSRGEPVGKPSDISATQERICRQIETNQNGEVLVPGQTFSRPQGAFVAGAPILYIVGCIKYGDQFAPNRWTKFCYEPDARDPNNFIACLGYNSTDADESSKIRQPPN